jgi:divalent metal cation (Fe/Co/Zn/Cd) transporter
MHMGPTDIVVNLDVDFKEHLTGAEIEATIDEIEAAVREAAPAASQIFVEPESQQ